MSFLARFCCGIISIYRYITAARPPVCRFTPSCSKYALEALKLHSILRGGWLITRRLSRCHPWGGCGEDLVPVASKASAELEK